MNCDRLARWYRWLEYAGFGRALERRREAFLPELADARRVLMLGEGDGRFLAKFLWRNGQAEVDCVDSSAEMLDLAKRRAAHTSGNDQRASGRVRFHHSGALAWLLGQPSARYDVICTHFFLDCFTAHELSVLVPEIARLAKPRSVWIVSEFCYLPAGLGGRLSRWFVCGLYWFFRAATGLRANRLPDHPPILGWAGFQREKRASGFAGLLVSECWRRPGPPAD